MAKVEIKKLRKKKKMLNNLNTINNPFFLDVNQL